MITLKMENLATEQDGEGAVSGGAVFKVREIKLRSVAHGYELIESGRNLLLRDGDGIVLVDSGVKFKVAIVAEACAVAPQQQESVATVPSEDFWDSLSAEFGGLESAGSYDFLQPSLQRPRAITKLLPPVSVAEPGLMVTANEQQVMAEITQQREVVQKGGKVKRVLRRFGLLSYF